NVWVWSALFAILIFVLNVLTVKFFAESEFWFSSIKVIAIVIFIVLGVAAMLGFLPMTHSKAAPFFSNFTSGGLFPHGA
ncbi:S-methylmethionine permease, partial [Bacillus thuringiensis]|nr:S-methylmethionine permease [Bacillus thuringiensis]